jgi:hypothetical protein
MTRIPSDLHPASFIPHPSEAIPDHWAAALVIARRVVATLAQRDDPAVRQAAQTLAAAFATDPRLPGDEQARWQRISLTPDP